MALQKTNKKEPNNTRAQKKNRIEFNWLLKSELLTANQREVHHKREKKRQYFNTVHTSLSSIKIILL